MKRLDLRLCIAVWLLGGIVGWACIALAVAFLVRAL